MVTPDLAARTQPAALPAGVLPAAVGVGIVGTSLALLHPHDVLTAVLVVVVLAAMIGRVEWAALAYVAVEPFGDALKSVSSTSVKLVGALLFVAWLIRLLLRARPVQLRHRSLHAAAALAVVVLAATTLHPNGSVGIEVATRYVSYLAVLVVLVDLIRCGLPARRVAAAYVLSCTAAAAVGLTSFLDGHVDRAAGPMADANDFAFFLVAAVPLALALAARRHRAAWTLAAVLIAVTTLATFSRGAVLGLAAMTVYAVVAGLVRLRTVVAALAGLAVAALVVVAIAPGIVSSSLEAKQHVAGQNVDDRFVTWSMAAEMTADNPVLGVGPGGFSTHFEQYVGSRIADTQHMDVAHDMYLQASSELGLLGLGAFVAMIGCGVAGARRAARSGDEPELGRGVCAAFAAVLVAAAFLSEQYYLPLWLLVALGTVLDPTATPVPEQPEPEVVR